MVANFMVAEKSLCAKRFDIHYGSEFETYFTYVSDHLRNRTYGYTSVIIKFQTCLGEYHKHPNHSQEQFPYQKLKLSGCCGGASKRFIVYASRHLNFRAFDH